MTAYEKALFDNRPADDDLVDLNTVVINTELPPDERIQQFLEQIKNTYHFKVGNVKVTVKYKENGPSFQECFTEMLSFICNH